MSENQPYEHTENQKKRKLNLAALGFLRKKWYLVIFLLAIMFIAFWVRAIPARFNEQLGLDEFYYYRISEATLRNNFIIPEKDYMRIHPFGTNPRDDYLVTIYLPLLLFKILTTIGISLSYFGFVLIYPPLIGALSALIVFFIGKELYDWRAGLLSAFFISTIPAFISRTSAGLIEKEAALASLHLFSILFFIKAYKSSSWKYGILSGISLAFAGSTSSIPQFYYLIYTLTALAILLISNKNVKRLLCSFVPTVLVAGILPFFYGGRSVSLEGFNPVVLFATSVAGLVIVSVLAERFKLVKPEQTRYIAPALIAIFAVVFLISTMFIEQSNQILSYLTSLTDLRQLNPIGFTVAENQAGNWNAIVQQSGTEIGNGLIPQLAGISGFFSIWIFAFGGIAILLYKIFRGREFIHLFLIIWLLSSVFATFFQIRLIYIYGPAASVIAGLTIAFLINNALKLRSTTKVSLKKITQYLPIYIVVLLALLLATNFATAYIFGISQSPSICFPKGDNYKCTTVDAQGNMVLASDQPWYQAFDFMAKQTPEDSNFMSWWDFGYWFQTRGKRPSVSDGGAGPRKEVADWFTDDVSKWNQHIEPLLSKYKVDYILMDYTLPPKYGAITAIHSDGKDIRGFLQVGSTPTNQFKQGNVTLVQYDAGQFKLIVPTLNGGIADAPYLIQASGENFVGNPAYINDICSSRGITAVADRSPNTGGCLSASSLGLYFLPADTKGTIFSSLMFMDGAGLPVSKVFDNQLIKIYKITGNQTTAASPINNVTTTAIGQANATGQLPSNAVNMTANATAQTNSSNSSNSS